MAFATGVDGLFPLVSLPYIAYIKNKEADEIYENYQEDHCNKKNSA
ncbi:Hypothetical protein LEPBI_I2189 [Leptospira biflexa serovar Patoc strain 'Patoc 1 (Paris)']|uniref:Uncharacterized protein n=1 Tax=Leptospira biflexa serovar Patoc (strain Patoc 1 / ATCC 23582 / Paris) TaxID=456481 RepID=B0ST48_LEPBP|nr:Hypothetical protein LEPBI_I2189 [Leptospira biflexa serovar Patoc strain 'Patoc 1 (Paris)']